MKIALIGASGFVGSSVLNELLQRGHKVTAIVRSPEKIKPSTNLTLVKANVTNENEVTEAVANHDAVVSAYNAGWSNPNLYNDFLEGSKSIQSGVKKSGVGRLLVVGGAGSLFISSDQQIVDTEGFPEEWKPGALAARDYLNILKEEEKLDWTFLSPAVEMHHGTSGQRKGTYRTGSDYPVFDGAKRSVISVEDVAVAIVDELENPKHIRRRFTVAY